MTSHRDPDDLLAAYLADGMTVLPDRVVVAVLDEVHRTRQRTVFGPWGTKSVFRAALAAAAVFAVLAVGGAFFLGQRGQPAVVAGPSQSPVIASPTPSATVSPSVAPSPTVVPPTAASWTTTGSMAGPRASGIAMLLQDGKVLVAGGNSGASLNAELYDPGTGTWAATGAMITPRSQFAVAPLLDGRVLVVGGAGDPGVLASAELYDPSTGTWAPAGSMQAARYNTTATLLPDGKVLVAGGNSSQNASVASAELYDPRSGSWTATGSMGTARSAQTATELRSGKVLVAGGSHLTVLNDSKDPSHHLATAELYDPGTGTWTPTGDMTEIRSWQTATLLGDGRVLVVGGAGDPGDPGLLASAELYDPSTGIWTATGSMLQGRYTTTATLLSDGRVLVAGGVGGKKCDPASATAELYDPSSGTWGATSDMAQGRSGHTTTLLPDGRVLAAGGSGTPGSGGVPCGGVPDLLSSAELYDPSTR